MLTETNAGCGAKLGMSQDGAYGQGVQGYSTGLVFECRIRGSGLGVQHFGP